MSYVDEVIQKTIEKNPGELEFHQTVKEVLESIRVIIDKNEEKYRKNAILERLVEPERIISFRVPWVDDNGNVQVNKGYRVQFSSAIGPYKGGLRFHPTVNQSIVKFLGFEQIFKNSLTGLPIGGGKGGSNFNPIGKTDGEIMRFCQSFMNELYRYIGPDLDCPAGDIGVSGKEIGYLFGQYKKIVGEYKNGALSGKGLSYGGSLARTEATGFGAVYFADELLKHHGEKIKDMTFAVSGFGNVAWGTAKKITELGGKVVTISGPDGYIYDPDGIQGEKIDYMLVMRDSLRDKVQDYADKFGVQFFEKQKPWGKVKANVYMPCATQNEIRIEDVQNIKEMGVKYLIEVSNMPTTEEAVKFVLEQGVIVAPSKAVNAGGVSVSALEMSQNSLKLNWSFEEVDERLKNIMKDIFNKCKDAAERYDLGEDYIAGANIAAFEKILEAMNAQGIV